MSERTASTDLRVQKTKRDIQRALMDMIAKKPYRQIRVNDVLNEALVSKHTFYRHYSSLDDVLDSIEETMIGELSDRLDRLTAQNLRGGVRAFYDYLNTDDPSRKKLFLDDEYQDFFRKLKNDYFSLDYFRQFYQGAAEPELVTGYLGSAAGIFREWKKGRMDVTLEQLADMTAQLFMNGLNGP